MLIHLSHCSGLAVGGNDFEDFIGAEKAKEFKALFGAWIRKIYRALFLEVFLLTTATDAPI